MLCKNEKEILSYECTFWNKNYYVVRNAGWESSINTTKLIPIFNGIWAILCINTWLIHSFIHTKNGNQFSSVSRTCIPSVSYYIVVLVLNEWMIFFNQLSRSYWPYCIFFVQRIPKVAISLHALLDTFCQAEPSMWILRNILNVRRHLVLVGILEELHH